MVVHDKKGLYNLLQVTRDKIAELCLAPPYANLRNAVTLGRRSISNSIYGVNDKGY